jgi:hypothetical protein
VLIVAAYDMDQVVIFGEAHLRRILFAYARLHSRPPALRPCGELFNGLAALPLYPFWPGYIINMSGYDFRKGQGPPRHKQARWVFDRYRFLTPGRFATSFQIGISRIMRAYKSSGPSYCSRMPASSILA